MSVQFDYTYDTSGFFSDPARRAILQAAATEVTGAMTDNLTAITPSGSDAWTVGINDPSSGGSTTIDNPTIPANTILVYVGAYDLPGAALGLGGFGGFTSTGSTTFTRNIRSRGQPGALQTPATDFAPFAGSIAFDSVADFHFGATTSDLGSSQNDFLSVAEHEINHVLGFPSAPSFQALVSGSDFTGPKAEIVFGGPVPLEPDGKHLLEGTSVGGQEAVMDPTVTVGTRKTMTSLDYAVLDDIGWNFDAPPPPTVDIAATDSSASEPSSNGSYRITRQGDLTSPLDVDFVVSGSALRGTDYTLALTSGNFTGTHVTIGAGESSIDITLRVRDDSVVESAETATLTLAPSSNYTVGTAATVSIADDDLANLQASRQAATAVDVSRSGRPSDLGASDLQLSANGRYATFISNSTDLVSSPLTTYYQVYRRDLLTGATALVSIGSGNKVEGNNDAITARMSADGRYVAFETTANNIVGGGADVNGASDVYVRDMQTNQITLISRNTAGAVGGQLVAFSADGEKVLFSSSTVGSAFVKGLKDANGGNDLFVFNRRTGRFTCVTVRGDGTRTGNRTTAGSSSEAGTAAFNSDGHLVVFASRASDLVTGVNDGNTFSFDVFVRDLDAKTTEYVSVSGASAGTGGNVASGAPDISDDGRYVVFRSSATNLVTGVTDSNDDQDIFLRDRQTGTTRLLTQSRPGATTADGGVGAPDISGDGRFVAFTSTSDDLLALDDSTISDAYLYNVGNSTLSLLSVNSINDGGGDAPTIGVKLSEDGTRAALLTFADNLPGDFDKQNADFAAIYTRDLTTGANSVVTFDRGGNPASADASDIILSADGTRIGFSSENADLVRNDLNGTSDVFTAPVFGREPVRIDAATGKITVLGSPINDVINVQRVNSTIVVIRDEQRFEFPTSAVTAVEVVTGAGDDSVTLGTNLTTGTRVSAGDGNDTIHGSGGTDNVQGGPGRDLIYGGAGNDRLDGGKGNDTVYGETGDDNLFGGDSDDHLYGGGGRDRLTGGIGSDTLDAGSSNDRFYANDGTYDLLLGGDGNDTASNRDGQDVLNSVEAG